MVIVDTAVWLDYINLPDTEHGRVLDSLLANGEVQMVGPVLTEILQGCRSQSDYDFWSTRLGVLPYLEMDKETWLIAAQVNRALIREGNMMGFGDLLISALALRHSLPVLSRDGAFARVNDLRLYPIR